MERSQRSLLTLLLMAAGLLAVPANMGQPSPLPSLSHPPIYITGDADFLMPGSGVTGGMGTPADPYIIEGWSIAPELPGDHGTSRSFGVLIKDVTRSFVLLNLSVHPGFDTGILIASAVDANLENVRISGTAGSALAATNARLHARGVTVTDSGGGITITDSPESYLKDVSLTGNHVQAAALSITNSGTVQASDVIIQGYGDHNQGTAVHATASGTVGLSDLKVESVGSAPISLVGVDAVRLQNVTTTTGYWGIYVGQCSSFEGHALVVEPGSPAPLQVRDCDEIALSDVAVSGATGTAIAFSRFVRADLSSVVVSNSMHAAMLATNGTMLEMRDLSTSHAGGIGLQLVRVQRINATRVVAENSAHQGLHVQASSSVRLEGFSATGSGGVGIGLQNVTEAQLLRVDATDNRESGLTAEDVGTLAATDSRFDANGAAGLDVDVGELSLAETSFSRNGKDGLASQADRVDLQEVEALRNGWSGVVVRAVELDASQVQVSYNGQDSAVAAGIAIDVSAGHLRDVAATGNAGDGIAMAGEKVIIENSTVTGNGRSGLLLSPKGGAAEVRNTRFQGNGGSGATVVGRGQPQPVIFSDSQFLSNKGDGLHVDGRATVSGSKFFDNGRFGIFQADGAVVVEAQNSYRDNGAGKHNLDGAPQHAAGEGHDKGAPGVGSLRVAGVLAGAALVGRRITRGGR